MSTVIEKEKNFNASCLLRGPEAPKPRLFKILWQSLVSELGKPQERVRKDRELGKHDKYFFPRSEIPESSLKWITFPFSSGKQQQAGPRDGATHSRRPGASPAVGSRLHCPGSVFLGHRGQTPLTLCPGFTSPNRAAGQPPRGPSKLSALRVSRARFSPAHLDRVSRVCL